MAPLLKAIELSPKDPRIFGYYLQLCLAHFLLGDYELSLKYAKAAIVHGREDPYGHLYLAMAHFELNQMSESKAALGEAKTLLPVLSTSWLKKMMSGMNNSVSAKLLDVARRMGLQE